MKYEWRKLEKELYIPKIKPMLIEIPKMNFLVLRGEGNPNGAFFSECIEALYAASYGARMAFKNEKMPGEFTAYTVYPLEGVWDVNDAAKTRNDGTFTKDELVFDIMIRQPDFITEADMNTILEQVYHKKKIALLKEMKWLEAEEGNCVQIMHIGPYDDEPESFSKIADFCEANNLKRLSKIHREIYLSDARKVSQDKLKTVLRIQVE